MKKFLFFLLFLPFLFVYCYGYYNFQVDKLTKVGNNIESDNSQIYLQNLKKKIELFTKIEISLTRIIIFGNKIGYDTSNLMTNLLYVQKLRSSYYYLNSKINETNSDDYKRLLKEYNSKLVVVAVEIKSELKMFKKYLSSYAYSNSGY